RVTGDIPSAANALIASTLGARTAANYSRRPRGEPGGARLFSARVESGGVTRDTWLMIQALPRRLRAEDEALNAHSLVFYPRKLIAAGGAAFDRLARALRTAQPPWESELDLVAMRERVVEHLDDEYASLRFELGRYAREVGALRREAQLRHGKGGAE